MSSAAIHGRGHTIIVLAISTGLHALSASTVFVIPAIAPEVAQAHGAATALIGLQVSLVYIGAMVTSAFAGSIEVRLGSVRASQLSLAVSVAGLAMALASSLPLLGLASLVLGVGYGLINPPTVVMLDRVTTPATRGLLFSIKQSAVPLGGIVAGLVGPSCALLFGWRGALLCVAAISVAAMVLLEFERSARGAATGRPVAGREPLMRDIQLLWRIVPLRWTTMAAFCFAGVQFTLTTYLVALLVESVGLGLLAAGIGFSIFQATALGGRVFWGLIADATRAGLTVLAIAYAASLLSLLPFPFMSSGWSLVAVYACLGLLGLCCAGWNGVFVSEVVRLSPRDAAGRAVGASFVYTFGGAVLIPPLFALVHHAADSYAAATWLIVAMAAAGCACVLRARAEANAQDPSARAEPADRHA